MRHEMIQMLSTTKLFAGLTYEQVEKILAKQGTFVKTYRKSEFIFLEEDTPQNLYLLTSGSVNIAEDTLSGKRITVTDIDVPGSLFGEVYLFMNKLKYQIHAQAAADSEVLVMPREVFSEDNTILMRNLLHIFAEKAWVLSNRVQIQGAGTLREKIVRLIYSRQMSLVMKREEMADALHVARPSLSRELSRMEKEGILLLDGRKISVANRDKFESYL